MPLTLHTTCRDHAVFQRDQPLPIRGTASPGETLTVEFAGEVLPPAADAEGRWLATFRTRSAGGPHAHTVRSGTAEVTSSGVYIGEVWLCSGQSNMEWTLDQIDDATEIQGARFPELHLLLVPRRVARGGELRGRVDRAKRCARGAQVTVSGAGIGSVNDESVKWVMAY